MCTHYMSMDVFIEVENSIIIRYFGRELIMLSNVLLKCGRRKEGQLGGFQKCLKELKK